MIKILHRVQFLVVHLYMMHVLQLINEKAIDLTNVNNFVNDMVHVFLNYTCIGMVFADILILKCPP
jgi:hypothetical protein